MKLRVNREKLDSLSPNDKKEAEKLLAELDELGEHNPLLFFVPHPKQRVFLEAKTPIKAFLGGNRSGKTTASIVDDLIQCVDAEVLPEHLKSAKKWEPPFYCRIITPDFTSTMEGVVFHKLREWVPKGQLLGGSWDKAYDKQRRILKFRNGSRLDFMSTEQDLNKFGGVALHRIHWDEEPPEDIRKESRVRLIDYGGDEVFSMTPLLGMSWVYEQVWERRNEPQISVVQVDMDENPHLNEEAKREVLDGLTPEERVARKEGRFVHFAGLMYGEFSEKHIVDPKPPEVIKGQDIVVGIDPGLNTTGVTWIAFDSDNWAHVFCELYPKNVTVGPICEAIRHINERWGVKPLYYVIDPSARNRSGINAENIESEYARHGIACVHGQNDRGIGITQVKRRLTHGGLTVSRDCPNLIWEFGRYRRDPNSSDEFAVIKQNDHCFIPGTMVLTDDGEIPIESIRLGDRVLTREGYFPVGAIGETRSDAPVRRLELSDRTLTGTGNHPVWVEGKGFTPLDSIRYGDILLLCPKSSSGTAASSDATPNPSDVLIGSTSLPALGINSVGSVASMKRSGKKLTVLSPMGITSITSTATPSTTTWRTSPVSQPRSTSTLTGRPSGATDSASELPRFALSPRSGTEAKRDWLGTASTDGMLGPRGSRSNADVTTAVKPSSPSPFKTTASARTPASPRGDGRVGLTMSKGRARSVASSTRPIATQGPRLVRASVVGNYAAGRSPVYNLTVLGPPEFFANGVLVHNCLDSLRYALLSRPWLHGIAPQSKNKHNSFRANFAEAWDPKEQLIPASPPLGALS